MNKEIHKEVTRDKKRLKPITLKMEGVFTETANGREVKKGYNRIINNSFQRRWMQG